MLHSNDGVGDMLPYVQACWLTWLLTT